MRRIVPILLVLLSPSPLPADEPPPLLVGESLQRQLDAPFLASFENIPLEGVLAEIRQTQQVSVFLDRHVDPQQQVTLAGGGRTLREFLQALAGNLSLGISHLDSGVYLGPRPRSDKLRTLIRLRTDELQKLPFAERAAWLRRQTHRWERLAEPRQVVQQLVASTSNELSDPDDIEHDLWRGAELPDTTLVEALALILIQFDRTWVLDPAQKSVRLAPLPRDVSLEKTYSFRRGQTLEQLRARIPGVDAQGSGRRVTVRGTVEIHEQVENFITGKSTRPQVPEGVLALDRRRFTLTVEGIPASAIMRKLEESGLRFEFEPAALRAANIDLNTHVKIDVKDATADTFFEALFEPLGVDVALEGITIRLAPKD